MFKTVNQILAVGSVAEIEALQAVAKKGYKTVIDLCPAAEGNQLDASKVKQLGLGYVSVPISPKNLTADTLASFTQAMQASPQPIYIRCASGLRASVFSLLVLAAQEGWTEAQYLEQLQTLGIEHQPNCPLADFAHTYFEQKI